MYYSGFSEKKTGEREGEKGRGDGRQGGKSGSTLSWFYCKILAHIAMQAETSPDLLPASWARLVV